ncbi:hypothetical protein D3C76_1441310 [compost metagenome]
MRVSAHRADHQQMLRSEPFAGQGRIHHQGVVGMDKGLFAARLTPRGAQTAKDGVHRILNLGQRIGQLRIVRIKHPFNIAQRATRRGGDIVDLPLLNKHPQQVPAHQAGRTGN